MTRSRKDGGYIFDASRGDGPRALDDPLIRLSPGITRNVTPAGLPDSTTEVAELDTTEASKGGHVLLHESPATRTCLPPEPPRGAHLSFVVGVGRAVSRVERFLAACTSLVATAGATCPGVDDTRWGNEGRTPPPRAVYFVRSLDFGPLPLVPPEGLQCEVLADSGYVKGLAAASRREPATLG